MGAKTTECKFGEGGSKVSSPIGRKCVSDLETSTVELGFPGGLAGKESACNAGDPGSIPRWGRCPGEGHGNTLQYSCLENPQGQRSLVGYSPWGSKESDTTATKHSTAQGCLISSSAFYLILFSLDARVQPQLIQGIRRRDGVGEGQETTA